MPIIAVKTIKKITWFANKIKLFNSLNICDILMKLLIRDKESTRKVKSKSAKPLCNTAL